jgi:hypothetical protein
MLGFRADETLGHTRDEHSLGWKEDERANLEQFLAERRPFIDFIYSRTRSDGLPQYLMVSGEPMFDSSGRYTGYRGVGKDVTKSMP